jgi:hypothetical protein
MTSNLIIGLKFCVQIKLNEKFVKECKRKLNGVIHFIFDYP